MNTILRQSEAEVKIFSLQASHHRVLSQNDRLWGFVKLLTHLAGASSCINPLYQPAVSTSSQLGGVLIPLYQLHGRSKEKVWPETGPHAAQNLKAKDLIVEIN